MKPRVSLSTYQWLQAFERMKSLPAGTKLGEFTFSHVLDDPHPPSVWLTHRVNKKLQHRGIRLGDPLIFDLARCI
jgi:hypothetical protein